MKVEIPPEIINNIGTLHFKLGDMEKAKVSLIIPYEMVYVLLEGLCIMCQSIITV